MSKHHIVVGLGFGDEGKGTTVEHLVKTRGAKAVIRFNGGQQAGHNIVTSDGKHHTFSQFGAATLLNIPTYVSKHCTFDPLMMYSEAGHLHKLTGDNPYGAHAISEHALLTTPYHIQANKLREEQRGNYQHGTVGVGFGETVRFALEHPEKALRAHDLLSPVTLYSKLKFLAEELKREGFDVAKKVEPKEMTGLIGQFSMPIRLIDDSVITEVLNDSSVVFEGAQGFLLDENYGFHPNTTWSSTTPHNALELLSEAGETDYSVVGVTRSYHTRHGNGPFPSEDTFSGAPEELHNSSKGMQGKFRVGALDVPLLEYALDVVNPDELMVTHADILSPAALGGALDRSLIDGIPLWSEDRLFAQRKLGKSVEEADRELIHYQDTEEMLRGISMLSGKQELMISTGPTSQDKSPWFLNS